MAAKPDAETFRAPFFQFFTEQTEGASNWVQYFDLAGLEAPEITDDSDPKSLMGQLEEYEPYKGYERSIGRAEIMLAALLDSAGELASIINRYKQKEITDRIHEIETQELSKPETRKKAISNLVRLSKMRDKLDKKVRWTFPQWKALDE